MKVTCCHKQAVSGGSLPAVLDARLEGKGDPESHLGGTLYLSQETPASGHRVSQWRSVTDAFLQTLAAPKLFTLLLQERGCCSGTLGSGVPAERGHTGRMPGLAVRLTGGSGTGGWNLPQHCHATAWWTPELGRLQEGESAALSRVQPAGRATVPSRGALWCLGVFLLLKDVTSV